MMLRETAKYSSKVYICIAVVYGGGWNMRQKYVVMVACAAMLIAAMGIPVSAGPPSVSVAGQDTQLTARVYGSLTLLGINRVGLGISNQGNVVAHDVSYTFTVAGGFDDTIHFTRTDELDDIQPYHSVAVVYTRAVSGFGPVTVSMTADSSNANDVSASAVGFQLGYFVFVLRG